MKNVKIRGKFRGNTAAQIPRIKFRGSNSADQIPRLKFRGSNSAAQILRLKFRGSNSADFSKIPVLRTSPPLVVYVYIHLMQKERCQTETRLQNKNKCQNKKCSQN